MKKLEDIQNIVNSSKEGWSDSRIAEEFNMSRNTVRKYRERYWKAQELLNADSQDLNYEEIEEILYNDPKYDSSNRKPYKYTRDLDILLDKILKEEAKRAEAEGQKYKPLTKTKIHAQIRKAGFKIGYTTISRKIDEKRLAKNHIGPWNNMDQNLK